MSAWSRLRDESPGLRIIGVVTRADPAVTEACEASGSGAVLALDASEELARLFNASWKPRAFLVNGTGVITYMQGITVMDGLAVEEVRDLLRRGGAAG